MMCTYIILLVVGLLCRGREMRCVDEISEDLQGRSKDDKSFSICRRHIHVQ
ncbi:hypothetical protein FRX31_020670, partial [Thalictrum thalictroides]